jgi:tetratricopeptide (TPR) repeat protein
MKGTASESRNLTASRAPKQFRVTIVICMFLGLVTFALYWPVRGHDFVNYDDPDYVTENIHVHEGLTGDDIKWAFGRIAGDTTYWHPVTWLSHMLDCQLFGVKPGPHHLVNVLFHVINALLLFILLKQMTGALWRSAIVAALFAWHPLQVDTVAWIAERKNVLSAFFWMLTMLAYVRYINVPTSNKKGRTLSYLAVLVCFGFGLMAKPMLVTLPFVLLLLDFWPLRRFGLFPFNLRKGAFLGLEKLPLLAFAAASAIATIIAHQRLGSLTGLTQLSFWTRLANALVSYVRYIGKVVWPVDLAVFYPYTLPVPTWQVIGAAFLLVGFSVFVFRNLRQRPYLAVGWFWFLGTLIPVIGLIQAGVQAMADRFTYLPMIGLYICAVWRIAEVTMTGKSSEPNDVNALLREGISTASVIERPRGFAAGIMVGVPVIALLACAALTARQLRYWRNSQTLFEHAIAVTSNNYIAENYLGLFFAKQANYEKAAPHFLAATQIKKDYAEAFNNLGKVFLLQSQFRGALTNFYTAVQIAPASAEAQYDLGVTYLALGGVQEAVPHLIEATQIKPDYVDARLKLASLLSRTRHLQEAMDQYLVIAQVQPTNFSVFIEIGNLAAALGDSHRAASAYSEALSLNPTSAQAHNNLGNALITLGKLDEAIVQYHDALKCKTNYVNAHHNLGLAFARQGKLPEAIAQFDEVLRLDPADASAHYDAGNVLLKRGMIDEAVKRFESALRQQTNCPEAIAGIGNAMRKMGRTKEAIDSYRRALTLNADLLEALQPLAWVLATGTNAQLRNGGEAVRLAARATELDQGKDPETLDALAAANAELGRFPEAVVTAQKARFVARDLGQEALAAQIEARERLYNSGQPFREP